MRRLLVVLLFVLSFHTRGLSSTNLADAWLNVLRGTTFTGAAAQFVKLHTGDPGAAAAGAPSANTTRVVMTWAAPAGTDPRSISLTGTAPAWAAWAAGTETISDISVWSASTAGTFYFSVQLTTPRVVNNGDTLTLSSASVSMTPIAA